MGIVLITFGIIVVFYTLKIKSDIRVSKEIIVNTVSYQLLSTDTTKSVLVLGDSTAVGVGATTREDSVPALFSRYVQATYVENRAVTGAKIRNVAEQIQNCTQEEYTSILLQIGANNVVAGERVQNAEQELRSVLTKLPTHQKLIVLMCGDVGAATLLPWFVRPYYTRKSRQYHALFERVLPEYGGTYINLYAPKVLIPFREQPDIYLAKDHFHPSSAGYKLWADEMMRVLQ